MPATLKNISNTPVTVILDHAAFLNTKSGWRRSTAKFANMGADGNRSAQEVRRSFPGTLTIQPGEEISDLHPAISKCAQVPNLISRRILTVTLQDEPTPEQQQPREALQHRASTGKVRTKDASEDKENAR